jgi:hypothetical protein
MAFTMLHQRPCHVLVDRYVTSRVMSGPIAGIAGQESHNASSISIISYSIYILTVEYSLPGPRTDKKLYIAPMLKGPTGSDLPEFQLTHPGLRALPHLPIHKGLSYLMRNYACLAKRTLVKHYQRQRAEHGRAPGRPPKVDALTVIEWKKVFHQRLFVNSCNSRNLAVTPPAKV